MRLAWFSPMPPVRTGIAAVSAELVVALAQEHVIDVYTDTCLPRRSGSEGGPRRSGSEGGPRRSGSEGGPRRSGSESGAHEFVWRQRQRPYDLIVYQVGNSSHHDYIWPYLFRYPGLTVLHDAHLHHARAAALLRTRRARDYRAEFAANHPGANPDLAELAVAGFDNHLYYLWPMTRLMIETSKVTAVHTPALAASLREEHPAARIASIHLAHGEPVTAERARAARARVRKMHHILEDAMVFGVFGGLTPEKRIPQILDALGAVLPYAPSAHLLLAGAAAQHFDADAAVRDRGLAAHVTMAGYLPDDGELMDHVTACDVSINLRWPTAREMSGPWVRALAAGQPTITTDLAHLADVPSLDPRTWSMRPGSGIRDPGSESRSDPASRTPDRAYRSDPAPRTPDPAYRSDPASRTPDPTSRTPDPASRTPDPVTIAVDILDEDHSLRLAMRRLATDAALRASLGASARAYWDREHSMPRMLEDYRRLIAEAAAVPAPTPVLPPHVFNNGDATLGALLAPFDIDRATVFGD